MNRRLLRIAALAGLLAGAAHAQWLDTTVCSGMGNGPCAPVYDSIDNKVYCADEASRNVTVIDGASSVNRKVLLLR
jgi:hypothetical protein